MDAANILLETHQLVERASGSPGPNPSRPPVYKAVGLILAVSSGLFIGTSFVLKKVGLLKANAKYNEEAGEGYGYLKNAYWWSGMTLMIIGEICNFVAYAFVDAILVTPLGALSVVVTTILSAIFLKERLSFVGKVACFNCIIGSVVIVMNAPAQSSVADIQQMQHYVIAPGFLAFAGVIIVGCIFIALWVGPKYGKKTMLVYLSICSLIGGLSVVATQGLGSAVLAQAAGRPQFNQWFLYVLLVFVIVTLVTEIIYLNKALNIFNAALVTPTYYVFFTSSTIVTSAVLFQGFKGTPLGIATVIMGFFQICSGVVLLQLSKSAKDVPDAAVLKGDLDQVREVAEQEQPETEPKADAIRGTAAIIRRISVARRKMEEEDARRLREDTLKDRLEPLGENEVVEWDGLRRRKTVIGSQEFSPSVRRKTIHPPLGMSKFPDESGQHEQEIRDSHSIFDGLRDRAQSVLHPHRNTVAHPGKPESPIHPVALTEINVKSVGAQSPIVPYGPGSLEEAEEHIFGLPPGLRKGNDQGARSPRSKPLPSEPPDRSSANPSHERLGVTRYEPTARRQFSFSNIFHRDSRASDRPSSPNARRPTSRPGVGSRSAGSTHEQRRAMKDATEEERLGLVKGDSHTALLGEHSPPRAPPPHSISVSESFIPYDLKSPPHYMPNDSPLSEDDEDDGWQMMNVHSDLDPRHPSRPAPEPSRSQPPIYQVPPSSSPPRANIPLTRVVHNPSPTSTTPATTSTRGLPPTSNIHEYGVPVDRTATPEEYNASKRRFEQQRQGRGRGDPSGGAGAGGAFI